MAKVRKLDFTGVASFTVVSEGIHPVKIVSVEDSTSSAGDDMLKMTFEVISGQDKGGRLFDNFSLGEKALWKLKQLLVALGMNAEGKVKLDLDKLPGRVCDASVFHDEYNGRTTSKIQEYTKPGSDDSEDEDEDEDEEEEEEQKPAKKTKAAPAPAAPTKGKAKKKPEPEPEEDEEDEEDEDEEEEEEEKPAPKKGKAAATPAKSAKAEKAAPKGKAPAKGKKAKDEDEDDDDDWEED